MTAGAVAQASQSANLSASILKIDEARFAAMIRGDIPTLQKILADDLVYTHSSGLVEGKTEFIAALQTGNLKYISIDVEEKKARVYGTVGVVNGKARITINSRGQDQSFVIRYLDVYANRSGQWQMIAWQSTRIP